MMEKIRQYVWMLTIVLAICGSATTTAGCSSDGTPSDKNIVSITADLVWEYSQSHPDSFTIDVWTMKAPTKGIAVSYADTQNCHSREQLDFVVEHAMSHDGYVGGWLSSEDGLYYFDSTKVFPEDQLDEAIQFGKDNGQYAVYILSTGTEIVVDDYLNDEGEVKRAA